MGSGATVDRVQAAQYQLSLVLGFFPRVDTLLVTVLGLNVAMHGVLFGKAPELNILTTVQITVVALSWVSSAVSLLWLYRGAFPDTDGGVGSLVYFGHIAKLEPAEFVVRYGHQSVDELSAALLHQAWRNSCVLSRKFVALKRSFGWLLAATFPWLLALLSFAQGQS